MLWISHRGESYDAPENTMSAFRLAWERNTDGIELDIQLTADGQVVCIHDVDTGRVGNKRLTIAEETYENLLNVDVGIKKAACYKNEKIPLLSEVLSETPAGKIIYIELKSGTEILTPLHEAIKNSPARIEDLRIIDFKNNCLKECKKLMPEIKAYLLSGMGINEETSELEPTTETLINNQSSSKADGFDLHACEKISKEYLSELRSNGSEITVWTINDVDKAQLFIELGVDAITSDCAAYLQSKLEA
jgi:glycerophosphoryl diester phosphodiesterase